MTDIFPLLGQQLKTGVLTLQEDKEAKKVVQILFHKGMIVGTAFPSERPEEPPLAKRLIRGGVLSPEKWEKAYEQHKQQAISVENALLNTGMVVKEDLIAVLKLLTFETIYGLFKWQGGVFRFETKEIAYDPTFIEPISTEYLLLDVLRMVDEWPMLEERFPSFDMVLKKSDPTATLDDRVGTGWEKQRTVQMDVLYELVDGQRTIQEIIDLTFIGEFDSCKNLMIMMDAGLIETISTGTRTGKGKKAKVHKIPEYQEDSPGISSVEKGRKARALIIPEYQEISPGIANIEKVKKVKSRSRLRDAGEYLLVGVLALFLVVQWRITRGADFPMSQEERKKLQEIQAPLRKIEELKNMNAREVFFLVENRYPTSPAEIVDKGLLPR